MYIGMTFLTRISRTRCDAVDLRIGTWAGRPFLADRPSRMQKAELDKCGRHSYETPAIVPLQSSMIHSVRSRAKNRSWPLQSDAEACVPRPDNGTRNMLTISQGRRNAFSAYSSVLHPMHAIHPG